ncbi:WLM domain-containing protein [Sporodiniella umbellata]|nr:WLM domain-containing protein [Sporodiniella umbellata]
MNNLEQVNFSIRYHSETLLLEQWNVNSTLDAQKLLWKGKILKNDSTQLIELASIHEKDNRMLLMGSPKKAIEQVSVLDKKLEERKQYKLPSIKKTPSVPKAMPELQFTFHKISVLREFSHQEKARGLLERLRSDRGIQGIMKARRWSVGELTELTPFETSILGYNKNAGQLIALRLRTDDLSGFRHYDSVRKVLLHELAHNVWGDHDDNFHALNRQLNKDVISLDWTAHGGHALGEGDFYNPEGEEVADSSSYEAGTYKLGGKGLLLKGESIESRRERIANATLSRLTKQEEKEMDEGCGSSR